MVVRRKPISRFNVHCKSLLFVGAVFGPVGQLLLLTLVGRYTQHVAGPRAILFGVALGTVTLPPNETEMYRLRVKRGDQTAPHSLACTLIITDTIVIEPIVRSLAIDLHSTSVHSQTFAQVGTPHLGLQQARDSSRRLPVGCCTRSGLALALALAFSATLGARLASTRTALLRRFVLLSELFARALGERRVLLTARLARLVVRTTRRTRRTLKRHQVHRVGDVLPVKLLVYQIGLVNMRHTLLSTEREKSLHRQERAVQCDLKAAARPLVWKVY